MTRVGILGGGQLALMLAESLIALGADPAIFDPDPDAPARRRYALGASRPYDDRAALKSFLDACDVVTYEFENVPARAIRAAKSTTPIYPSLDVLETCQHRVREKRALRAAGAPTVDFAIVADRSALRDALLRFGLPAIVKTATGGYDGKGQRRYERIDELRDDDFPASVELVIEEPIAIAYEVSVIVARRAGRAVTLPLLENRHRHHILDVTLCPARVDDRVAKTIRAIALRIADALDVDGLLTVELFVDREGTIYVNELAPRPHNSGHVTRIACDRSQFDLHARAVLGMPLPSPRLVSDEVAFMANLMGDAWPKDETVVFGALAAHPQVRELFLYGKERARPGRKMGHLCGFAATHAMAITRADGLRRRAGLSGPRAVE